MTVDLRVTGPQRTTHADGTSNHDAAGDILGRIEGLAGSAHADKLIGNGETNYLFGAGGDDTLMGEGGNDELNGGLGSDTLYGGTGADTFIFGQESVVDTGDEEETRTLSDETDTVKDFKQSQGDRLDLRDLKNHSLFTGGTTPGTGLSLREPEGAAFTGVKGQVKWWQDDKTGDDNDVTHVQVDLDGVADENGEYDAEFQVTLEGLHTLTGTDLILA